ncbi:MAG: hypothetical protein HUJ68_13410 [Clostridia bacterium]|nr:hypothetical protein [Clostridia bacterium]
MGRIEDELLYDIYMGSMLSLYKMCNEKYHINILGKFDMECEKRLHRVDENIVSKCIEKSTVLYGKINELSIDTDGKDIVYDPNNYDKDDADAYEKLANLPEDKKRKLIEEYVYDFFKNEFDNKFQKVLQEEKEEENELLN